MTYDRERALSEGQRAWYYKFLAIAEAFQKGRIPADEMIALMLDLGLPTDESEEE